MSSTPIYDAVCHDLADYAAVRAEMRRQLCADIARAEVVGVVKHLAALLEDAS